MSGPSVGASATEFCKAVVAKAEGDCAKALDWVYDVVAATDFHARFLA